MDPRSSFSARHGYASPETDITVREDAPEVVRAAVLALGDASGLSVNALRATICEVLLKVPDRNNWGPSNVVDEARDLVFDAPWFRVYDIAERIHDKLYNQGRRADLEFALRLNEVFREHGIGYEMKDGRVIGRGSLAFREATEEAIRLMDAAAKPTAAVEMRHALSDITRRPPDITGAVQHGMAALECTARDVMGQPSASLGQLLPGLGLTKPLDKGLEGLWGYASQFGRHVAEGKDARFEEAELVVTISSALSVFLLRRNSPGV
jgi:hypothetical protein